jgi:hypothetical protein
MKIYPFCFILLVREFSENLFHYVLHSFGEAADYPMVLATSDQKQMVLISGGSLA